jgi:5-methylcytosine-specific restriction endonuclease McrA
VSETAEASQYPPEAYAPNGILWWKLDRHPGKQQPYGAELKICAWLAYNFPVGGTFTMRDVRAALGAEVANDDEHLNRRLRELRARDKWVIPTHKDDGSLPMGTYRIDKVGWHQGLGTPRAKSKGISQSTRRRVLERDGSRCVICGVADNEEYPGEPGTHASMTVGHILANDHGGSNSDLNNLRTECKRCNEPVRQEIRVPKTLREVLPDVRNLKRAEKERLLSWMRANQRTRDKLDVAYDEARRLSPDERDELQRLLQVMVHGGHQS